MRILVLVIVVSLVSAVGCSTPIRKHFLHKHDRLDFLLTADEIKTLQFYVSTRVVAIAQAEQAQSIVVPAGTPGVITEVGPEFLRVSFKKGTSVPFVADPTAGYQPYFLATTDPSGSGLQKLADTADQVFHRDGISYRIEYGASALLEVDLEQMRKLIARRQIRGRVVGED